MTALERRRRTDGFPSAGGALARAAITHAAARGFELGPLLKNTGLTHRQLENRKIWIPVRSQIQFVDAVAEALGDDCLGFNLGLTFDLRAAELLYYVLASSDRLIEALRRGARYTTVANEGIRQTCKESGSRIEVLFQYVSVSRHLDRHQIEFWMACLVRICRHITGLGLQPFAVRLTHQRQRVPSQMHELFGDNIEFGADKDELIFDRRVGELPIVSADPYLNRLLREYCEQALAQRGRRRGSFRTNVENAVAPLLPHGMARASVVAHELGLSSRTFARRLAAEGQTFSALVQKMRSDLSRRYLADKSLSISQIGWLLGYREVGAFSHAFKRHTGKTPREARSFSRATGDRVRVDRTRKRP
jgi:AraC-like DNA-binding protein